MIAERLILGIETSCDETAVALVRSNREIVINEIFSQRHDIYGGVIPELAAREHIAVLPHILKNVLDLYDISQIDAIAVTAGPGLVGGLIVGTTVAKALALASNKPCYPINHLEGHVLSPRLANPSLGFPYILLLMSGGHTQIIKVADFGQYHVLGESVDDAIGEAFDKVAKIIGLGYPGGPILEKKALTGDYQAFTFPRSFWKQAHCNFSFSGLKTAVLRQVNKIRTNRKLETQDIADIAASFQYTVGQIVIDRLNQVIAIDNTKHFALAGGVAANTYLRNLVNQWAQENGREVHYPPFAICTDNAAMIAWSAIEMLNYHDMHRKHVEHNLAFSPKSSWPI